MRILSVGLVLIVALFPLVPSAVSAAECGSDRYGVPIPCPDEDRGGVEYIYDDRARAFHPKPEGGQETERHGGVVWMVRYVVLCAGNSPSNPAKSVCVEAACESDGYTGFYAQVFRREDAGDAWEPWPGRERVCWSYSPPGDPIPLEDVEAEIIAVFEEHYEAIARPEIELAPPASAVVNLPVLAATEGAESVGFDIENPLPGRVEAVPEYSWRWSDGTTSHGAGQMYDGTDPLEEPEHYPVRATFTRSGDQSVELTATWSITLTVAGNPPITDIEPLVYEEAESFRVHSARTVLVD